MVGSGGGESSLTIITVFLTTVRSQDEGILSRVGGEAARSVVEVRAFRGTAEAGDRSGKGPPHLRGSDVTFSVHHFFQRLSSKKRFLWITALEL